MNYSILFEVIAKYYPIGVDRSDELYNKYSGTNALKELIDSHFVRREGEFSDNWVHFIDNVKAVFPEKLDIKDETAPVDVCSTLSLLINRKQIDNILHTQKLYFHLSYLGNYFCLYGKDTVQIIMDNSKTLFDPVITVSPMDVYYDYFIKLRGLAEEKFKNHNYLAHTFLKKRINGLKIFPSFLKGDEFSSVFQAFFVPENLTSYRLKGDILYL